MEEYILLSLITLFLWGLWGFGTKLSLRYVNQSTLYVYSTVGSLIVSIYYIMNSKVAFLDDPLKLFLILLPGFLGALGGIFFLDAISKGKASIVIAITALYPLVVSILSILILKEQLTIKQALGIAFSILGIILLSS